MARKKERIDTSGGDALSVNNPFASLSGDGLKSAPSSPPASPEKRPQKARETLLLRRLKAGKGGKVVTEISGFDAAPQQIDELLKRLQGQLGTGGTRKGKVLELQGECRDRIKPILEKQGYRVKGL
jgi:translation initiation factor 1